MNKVILIGRLVSDPTARVTATNNSQSFFVIACDSNFKSGNNQQTATFIPCVAWGNQANFINNYLKKGNLVSIEGKINRRNYISKTTNQQVTTFDVIVDDIRSLTTKGEANANGVVMGNTTTITNNNEAALSKAFPESVSNNIEPSEQKIEKPSFADEEEIEWFDESENNK